MLTETMLEKVKRKCYITDTSELTTNRLKDVIESALPKVKRMLGIDSDFDFEEEGNEEEYALFLNYCWYDWNDSVHEFNDSYLGDINSLHHKHEVKQYELEEEEN